MELRRSVTEPARADERSATEPTRAAQRSSTTSVARTSVFEEVLRLAATRGNESDAGEASAIGGLTSKDLEEIRTLRSPPTVVRRTLEATWLLLNAAKAPGPSPPSWQRVQKMLCDIGFLTRMQSFDAGVLEKAPELTAYIAAEYFGHGDAGTTCNAGRRSSMPNASSSRLSRSASLGRHSFYAGHLKNMSPPEPLTFERVHRASHAAGALFRWCTTTIVDALSEEAVLGEASKPSPSVAREEESTVTPASEASEAFSPEPPEERPLSRAARLPSPEPKALSPGSAQRAAKPPTPERKPASPAPTEDRSLKLPPIAAEPAAKPSQLSQPRQAPTWTPLPKPPEAPRREKPVPKEVWKPDRHFELLAEFDLGNCAITAGGEASMQTVAATICMRTKLKLELVTQPDRIEHEALAASRLVAATEFFFTNGIRPSTSEEERFSRQPESPGIICCLRLEEDRELGQYLINRENPDPDEDFKPSKQLLYILDWIESNFRTVKH